MLWGKGGIYQKSNDTVFCVGSWLIGTGRTYNIKKLFNCVLPSDGFTRRGKGRKISKIEWSSFVVFYSMIWFAKILVSNWNFIFYHTFGRRLWGTHARYQITKTISIFLEFWYFRRYRKSTWQQKEHFLPRNGQKRLLLNVDIFRHMDKKLFFQRDLKKSSFFLNLIFSMVWTKNYFFKEISK